MLFEQRKAAKLRVATPTDGPIHDFQIRVDFYQPSRLFERAFESSRILE
jgi:hypothetical protein